VSQQLALLPEVLGPGVGSPLRGSGVVVTTINQLSLQRYTIVDPGKLGKSAKVETRATKSRDLLSQQPIPPLYKSTIYLSTLYFVYTS